jgi:NADH-quinone oxidoreductase subunit L
MELPAKLSHAWPRLYKTFFRKWYVDEAYEAAVVRPIHTGSEKILWKGVDVGVIDWTVNAIARLFGFISKYARMAQTGVAETYVFVFIVGVVAIIGFLALK